MFFPIKATFASRPEREPPRKGLGFAVATTARYVAGLPVMSHRIVLASLAALSLFSGTPARAASPGGDMSPKAFMAAVNSNTDETISKDELDAYAKKRFAGLESDNDKSLDEKELKGRLSAAGMTVADTDKDKSVDESEFVGYADKLFDEANSKGDETLSLRELRSPAGKKLIGLLH